MEISSAAMSDIMLSVAIWIEIVLNTPLMRKAAVYLVGTFSLGVFRMGIGTRIEQKLHTVYGSHAC